MDPEKKLIQAILKGDEGAQRQVVDRYWRRLYVTAVHFLGYQDPEAEDAVQETFAIFMAKAGSFRFESSLYTWLNQVCVYQCYHRLRDRKRHLASQQEDLEAWMSRERAPQRRQEAAALATLKERRLAALETAILALEGPCREILRRRDLKGESYAGIAKALAMPLGTVMSRLSRCRQTLKTRLMAHPSLWEQP